MRWRSRVLRGRLREQAPVVAMVTAVAVVATTLVGLLAGLLHLSESQGVPTTLSRLAPDDLRIESVLWVNGEDTTLVLDTARGAVARITGDVPTSDTTWRIGSLRALPSAVGENPHLTYLSSLPSTDVARLVEGRWPDRATDGTGAVEVNVPRVAAEQRGWVVGTRIETRPWDGTEYDAWVVVGTHEPAGPSSPWSRDRLGGRGTDPKFNMPGSAGMRTTVAWGPVVVDPAVLAGPGTVDTVYLLTDPHLADADPAALVRMRDEIRNAAATLSETLQPEADGRIRTQLGAVLDATWREGVVVRAGVMTVGLLLATLATAVMLLAARLLAERRATENELLAARGASPSDLRSVVVLEALVLAALTWLAAPWVARAALVVLTGTGDLAAAGYVVGPGLPATVLLTCAVMSGVLAVALCVPAWHTAGSSTGSAHAGLLRAGGDLALLALGGLAMAQLVAYGSPLTRGATGLGVDLVLVAGPALVTLAAATVALRLVAPLGRLADLVAARARSFVVPLAAWQVARRPSIATGTVLVVVVAVTAGTFSAAFLSTWRTSQLEQADLALGTDVRVVEVAPDALAASAAVAAAEAAGGPDTYAHAVVDRPVGIGQGGNVGSRTTRVVAVDASRPQDLRGRTGAAPERVMAELDDVPPTSDAGADVPDGTQWIVASGVLTTTPVTPGTGLVHLTVEDPRGLLVQLPPRKVPLGEPFAVALEVPAAEGLRVVAVGALAAPEDIPPIDPEQPVLGNLMTMPVTLSLTGLHTVPRSAGIAVASVADTTDGPAMALSTDGWHGDVRQPRRAGPLEISGGAAAPDPELLRLSGEILGDGYSMPPAALLARAWPRTTIVPAVASSALRDELDARPGRTLTTSIAGTSVDVLVELVVDQVPGAPRSPALLVDQVTLARAVLEAGGGTVTPDAWWIAAPDAAVPDVVQAFAGTDAVVTTRSATRVEAVSGPVRVAVPATMSLVTLAATLLVLVGVGAVAAAAARARRLELARLQALGASRPGLMGGLVVESTVLVVLGAVVGLLAGYGLAAVVAPLLTMSPDGRAPVPDPWLVWGWAGQAGRAGIVVAGAVAVVAVVVALGVRRTSGAALRMGDDR